MFALWTLWRRIGGWRALMAQGLLAWRLMKDGRVPGTAKLILPAAVLYFISPINLSFQWIPLIGQIDDIAIAAVALNAFLKACPQHIVAEHAFRLEEELAASGRFDRLGRFGRHARPSFEKWTGNGRPGTP
ncbi:MAG TPA: YkvA family protein [Chloroflexota bacterium]|nr:YkvA family protein [Chloroflexota bacterium]